jgi:hypothetical protein
MSTLTSTKRKALAEQLKQVAAAWQKEGTTNFKKDAHMLSVYASDSKDLLAIHSLFAKGQDKAAAQKASKLDTIIREQIPTELWDHLQNYE